MAGAIHLVRVRTDRAANVAPHRRPTAVVFEVTMPDEHHHIPPLLSPYGYGICRRS